MKNLILYWLGAVALMAVLPGCTTAITMWDMAGVKENRNVPLSIIQDELYAIGRIETKEVLSQFPNAVALLGKQNTYVLLKGAEQLQTMTKNLDGRLIAYANNNGGDRLQDQPMNFAFKDGEFFGESWFTYKKLDAQLTDLERQTIMSFEGAKLNTSSGFYSYPVYVSGFLPKVPVEVTNSKTAFTSGRKIKLTQSEKRDVWVRYPKPQNLMLLPIAVAIDAVTLPFQALFLFSGANFKP